MIPFDFAPFDYIVTPDDARRWGVPAGMRVRVEPGRIVSTSGPVAGPSTSGPVAGPATAEALYLSTSQADRLPPTLGVQQ